MYDILKARFTLTHLWGMCIYTHKHLGKKLTTQISFRTFLSVADNDESSLLFNFVITIYISKFLIFVRFYAYVFDFKHKIQAILSSRGGICKVCY